jgi:hypothetical protein
MVFYAKKRLSGPLEVYFLVHYLFGKYHSRLLVLVAGIACLEEMALRRKAQQKKEVNLQELVQSGDSGAYEALQLYRSRALRFKAKSDVRNALQTAAEGAILLIRNGYKTAGSELAMLMVDFMDESGVDFNNDTHALIIDVDDSFEEFSPKEGRVDFLKACIKWTQTCGSRGMGDAQLHVRHGQCLWQMQEYKKAVFPFVAGEAPESLCQKISDTFTKQNEVTERDRVLTMGVCHFLAIENMRDANKLYSEFKKHNKNTDTKLSRFCDQLLQCCRRDATQLFKELVSSVRKDLQGWEDQETVYNLLMGPIGDKFFNIPPKVNPMMQMMQQLLS